MTALILEVSRMPVRLLTTSLRRLVFDTDSTYRDTLETWPIHQCQYITFKRKAYKLVEYRDGTKYKLKLEPIN